MSERSSPKAEEVVQRAFTALRAHRWEELVALTDATSLERFRNAFVEQHSRPSEVIRFTAEQLLKTNPDMPRAVAEWQAGDMTRRQTREKIVSAQINGLTSIDELSSLTTGQFLARWAQAREPEWQARHHFETRGKKIDRSVAAMVSPWFERTVLGSVLDSDDRVLVVIGVGATADGRHHRNYTFVIVVRDSAGRYLLEMSTNWLGLSSTFVMHGQTSELEDLEA